VAVGGTVSVNDADSVGGIVAVRPDGVTLVDRDPVSETVHEVETETVWVKVGVLVGGGGDVGDAEVVALVLTVAVALGVAVGALHVPSCARRNSGCVQLVHCPDVHVRQLLYWQQKPPVQMPLVHQSSVVHGSPLGLSAKHWLLSRYRLAAHAVHTPPVHVAQLLY
jgi:hypothetical protein